MEHNSEPVEPGSLTGAEMIVYWERNGAFIDGSDLPDSPEYARQVRAEAQQRSANTLDSDRLETLLDNAAKPGADLPDDALTSDGIYGDHL